jgi:predicted small secreted protein
MPPKENPDEDRVVVITPSTFATSSLIKGSSNHLKPMKYRKEMKKMFICSRLWDKKN